MEYYFKRTFYGDGISAVPPEEYADRFVKFIGDRVFPKQPVDSKSRFFKLQQVE
jgi:hypothetical protein